ncbi:MAG: hypothetical protein MJE68_18260 [Proteobacteria bacterium]|nr:hypothetical protein [Pseudomonadota bacterium]
MHHLTISHLKPGSAIVKDCYKPRERERDKYAPRQYYVEAQAYQPPSRHPPTGALTRTAAVSF